LEELSALNDLWIKDRAAAILKLSDLHQRLAYLTRWLEQARERQFRLMQ
jgi:Lon protease-like protein